MPIRDPSRRAEIAALRKWPARPAIFLTAGLSLLVVLAACSTKTKGKEGDQEEKQAALAKPQTPLTPIDWTKVAEGLGKAGTVQPGEVYKVSMPRGDLHVTVDGVHIKPALALGSWVGFKQTGPNEVTAMGDLVLLDRDVGSGPEQAAGGRH